jgi:hypothetical protein
MSTVTQAVVTVFQIYLFFLMLSRAIRLSHIHFVTHLNCEDECLLIEGCCDLG